jgi:hypothetical protein
VVASPGFDTVTVNGLPEVDILRCAEARSFHEVKCESEIFDSVFSRIWLVRSNIGIRIFL